MAVLLVRHASGSSYKHVFRRLIFNLTIYGMQFSVLGGSGFGEASFTSEGNTAIMLLAYWRDRH